MDRFGTFEIQAKGISIIKLGRGYAWLHPSHYLLCSIYGNISKAGSRL